MSDPAPAARKRWASRALRIGLAMVAVWALRRQLRGLDAAELAGQLRQVGWPHLLPALACAAASFLALGLVEWLALRGAGGTAGRAVPKRLALSTSFIASALSQSAGLALLTGAAVRARAYRACGLEARDVGRVSGVVTLAATLGLMAAGGIALVQAGGALGAFGVSLPARPIGALLLAVITGWLAWSATGARRSPSGKYRAALRPTLAIALTLLAVSALDWVLTASVLHAFLLPPVAVHYWAFVGAYLIAQTAAMASHVPAGAGVLEAALLGLTVDPGPSRHRTAMVAALVMFRVIYYLVPLGMALVAMGVAELRRGRGLTPALAGRANAAPLLAADARVD